MRARVRVRGERAALPGRPLRQGRAPRLHRPGEDHLPGEVRLRQGRRVRRPRRGAQRRRHDPRVLARGRAALRGRAQLLARRRVLRHPRHASRRLPVRRRQRQPPRADLHARRHPGGQDRRRAEQPDAPRRPPGRGGDGCGAQPVHRRLGEPADPRLHAAARMAPVARRRARLREHPEHRRGRGGAHLRARLDRALAPDGRRVLRHRARVQLRRLPRAQSGALARGDAVDPARRLRHDAARQRPQAGRGLPLPAVAAGRRGRGSARRAGPRARHLAQVA